MQILGVMSGSSLDGIDIACARLTDRDTPGFNAELLAAKTYPLPEALVDALGFCLSANASTLADTNYNYTVFLAECIRDFIETHDLKPAYCGVHGHTILHHTEISTSWQLVNGGLLSSLLRLTIVTDFRNQDMGAGGEGTPMAVLLDRDLFGQYDYCLNLGGIANISYKSESGWVAYDICPCNQVHNHFAERLGQTIDTDGLLAQQGQYNPDVYNALKQDPYILRKYPKSIDNAWITRHYIPVMEGFDCSYEDLLLTHYHFVADLILETCQPGKSILVTGGGAHNTFFVNLLRSKMNAPDHLVVPDDMLIDFKEAILMACMAYYRMAELSNFIPEATGAAFQTCGGAVYLYNPTSRH